LRASFSDCVTHLMSPNFNFFTCKNNETKLWNQWPLLASIFFWGEEILSPQVSYKESIKAHTLNPWNGMTRCA
jgi:hypothetical protein